MFNKSIKPKYKFNPFPEHGDASGKISRFKRIRYSSKKGGRPVLWIMFMIVAIFYLIKYFTERGMH